MIPIIIEWILSNFYFLIIVAFFLFSLLSRQKQAEQRRNRQEHRVEIERQKPLQPIEMPPPPARKLTTREHINDIPSPPARVTKKERSPSLSPHSMNDSSPRSLSVKPSTSDVIQGMMWAEVFGSPRAKKPYKPRYSHRNIR